MIVIAITRRHLSSDRQVLKYLFRVRHISDSKVFSLHDLNFSLRYFCRFGLLTSREEFLSSSSEDVGEADDGVCEGDEEGLDAGEMEIIWSLDFDILPKG